MCHLGDRRTGRTSTYFPKRIDDPSSLWGEVAARAGRDAPGHSVAARFSENEEMQSVVIGPSQRDPLQANGFGMTERITYMALHFERDDQLGFLRGLPLFSDCTTYELKRIRSQMTSINKDAGETLIEEGKAGSEFFVIVSGSASVWRSGRLLDHLQAGSFFGELSLLDGKCRTATVRAESPIHVLALSRREFNTLNSSVPSIARRIQAELGARLRNADDALDGNVPHRNWENAANKLSQGSGPW
jgi:CRP/FNR family cyclic AMP-dependent transcriptional regulator